MIATTTFLFLSSFHHPRLRPSPRRPSLPPMSSSSASWEREEARWLREEQRWLREEQRWLREESRWHAEREALLAEIAAVRRRVHALEPLAAAAAVDTVAAPAPAPAPAAPPRPALAEEAEAKEVVLEEKAVGRRTRRRTLRAGAEGEEVREMQEALEKLGFYSGEEDKEFSSFSTGTERAVKTWQASVGTAEDGVMTSELLERLFTEQTVGDVKTKDGVNGASVTAVTGIAEVQQTVIKESGDSGVEVSQHRVFLIGENRWEDPSRLAQNNKPISSATTASTRKCIACRGEGRLMCTECDGSGEPNIEPQFLEWVDEDMKCPYCEGLGYIICDVCEGKAVVES